MPDTPDINASPTDPSGSRRKRKEGFRRSDRSAQAFVSSVRSIDLSQASDEELRERAEALRHGAFDNDTLAECFAVINETIRRRIGAWQVFDPPLSFTRIFTRYRDQVHNLTGTDKT